MKEQGHALSPPPTPTLKLAFFAQTHGWQDSYCSGNKALKLSQDLGIPSKPSQDLPPGL